MDNNKEIIRESYIVSIDSHSDELLEFFIHEPIYLKFIGDIESFKHLDDKNIESLSRILQFYNSIKDN